MTASNKGVGLVTSPRPVRTTPFAACAALLALMAVTITLNEILTRLERRVFRWRQLDRMSAPARALVRPARTRRA